MNLKKTIFLKTLLPCLALLLLIISCDGHGCDKERQLNFNDPDVDIKNVHMNHHMYLFAETKQFIVFTQEKVVLSIYFDNRIHPFPVEAAFSVFDRNEDMDRIYGWINNQWSDAIFMDPAEPTSEEPLPADSIAITNETVVGQALGTSEELFDQYVVEYAVDAYTVDGLVSLSAFSHEASVYLKIGG